MMEAVHTSETSVYFNETTRRYIPEGFRLHTRRRENLKSNTDGNVIILQYCCVLNYDLSTTLNPSI
jgi:hypothetical protein